MYSTTRVQYLYISCYLSVNKPVLSYLLLRLLPHILERLNNKKSRELGRKILQALLQNFDTMMPGTFLDSIVKFFANE
jgi:hypothetical protein